MRETKDDLTIICFFSGDVPSRWRFRVGSTWANSGGIVHACSSINIHPDYSTRTIDSDVAIMHTITTITFNNVIQAASIAGPNYNIDDNQVVWAAGWGTIYVSISLVKKQIF